MFLATSFVLYLCSSKIKNQTLSAKFMGIVQDNPADVAVS